MESVPFHRTWAGLSGRNDDVRPNYFSLSLVHVSKTIVCLIGSEILFSKQRSTRTMIGHKSFVAECYHILHVEDGYRYSHNAYDTFLSLFKMHNETLNIWSHLVGFICVLIGGGITTYDLFYGAHQSSTLEIIAVETYLICAAICLLCSSIYHWFCCVSIDAHDWLLKLDLTGVALLVSGSFLPGVYYGEFPH
jgi:predicted membrane channel-forming protein YqfA (hemolysin III family)